MGVFFFYSSFVCTSAYANVYFQTTSNQHSCVRAPLRECRSIWSGASGLPYYCAPLVCVSEVIEWLAVWRHNKPKTKNLSVPKKDSLLFRVCGVYPCCVFTHVCLVLSLFCFYMYVRMPSSPGSIAEVPSSQALPGYLITALPSVCVPDVIGALAVWIQNQKIKLRLDICDT